jgi:hypothetical protein
MRKALISVLSILHLHVILLLKVTPRYEYVTLFTKGMSCPFSCSMFSGTLDFSEEIDYLNIPFIDVYVPAFIHDFCAIRQRCNLQRT